MVGQMEGKRELSSRETGASHNWFCPFSSSFRKLYPPKLYSDQLSINLLFLSAINAQLYNSNLLL
jgi:hypothetical protein